MKHIHLRNLHAAKEEDHILARQTLKHWLVVCHQGKEIQIVRLSRIYGWLGTQ